MSQTNDLTVSRIIKAPRSAVWCAWTDPKQLERWWAPAPIQTTMQKMEMRPGRAFNTVMRMEDGTEFPGKGLFP